MISICIPTYEMKNYGVEYLEYSFNILAHQTFKDFEIIISDHSINDEIQYLCKQWKSILNITYIRNIYNIGSSSANLNNAMNHANGNIIKILFQDDFLYNEYSLENQIKMFNGNWLVSACCHYNGIDLYKPFYPKYHDKIYLGHNTISSPSVLMIENKDVINFDENLIWLMDVDYYKRLYDRYGLPSICSDITIVNREHINQVSNSIINEKIQRFELKYMSNKYE